MIKLSQSSKKMFFLSTCLGLLASQAFAQTTHTCDFEAYLVSTPAGKSNVRAIPNGRIIESFTNSLPAAPAVAPGQTQAPAPVITTKVKVIGQSGEWFEISKTVSDNSEQGTRVLNTRTLAYMHKSLLAVNASGSTDNIKLYIEPNNRSQNTTVTLGNIEPNGEVRFSGCAGQYIQVQASNGAIGYIPSFFFNGDKPQPPVVQAPAPQATPVPNAPKTKSLIKLPSTVTPPGFIDDGPF